MFDNITDFVHTTLTIVGLGMVVPAIIIVAAVVVVSLLGAARR